MALNALMISLVALSIDSMLPALPHIASDLGAADQNDGQLIISFMFLGFGLGQILYGPLSDSLGRKRAIYAGIAVFIFGCSLSLVATNFTLMLCGRVLQGVGAASPRIVSTALIRDQYEGRAMARIMSMVMAVFIIVPAIAPAIGQTIVLLSHWRAIFGMLMIQALVAVTWLALRQPETLTADRRVPLTFSAVFNSVRAVCREPVSMGYALTAGLIFGAFIGYLSSAQQIFQEVYKVGELFPVYFGALALSLGLASLVNSKLVMRFGMRRISYTALLTLCALALGFVVLAFMRNGHPPLTWFMMFLLMAFYCIGTLFGNFNAMAMEPLGRVAGAGAAVVGSVSTLVSLVLGTVIGQAYNGTVLPMVLGFAVLALVALALMYGVERHRVPG